MSNEELYELYWDLEFLIGHAMADGDDDLAADMQRRQEEVSMELYGYKSAMDFEINEVYTDEYIDQIIDEVEESHTNYVLPH